MRLAIALVATCALAGCIQDETVAAYGAEGKLWVLQTLDNAPFPARATLQFEPQGRFSGQAPCNQFNGVQTAPYPWFETGPMASTKKACPELKAETAFLSALQDMQLAEVLGDTLVLSNEMGREMTFKAGL